MQLTSTITHFHGFCGAGGGAKGLNKAHPVVGNLAGAFECIGGFDSDPGALRDFETASGTRGTLLDAFTRDQYRAFHSVEPPPGWREATAADILKAAGGRYPSICVLSSPCKGISGLLPEKLAQTPKYMALNELTLRGVWLILEAFGDNPPEYIIFENVPGMAASRGRVLLARIVKLLHRYGYATSERVHDCGELGGLAQRRKRFLLLARHLEKVPTLVYEPPKRRVRAVGEVLRHLPLPGDPRGGPMHRLPSLAWKTWLRLAMVEAGGDWRTLNKLAVVDGVLRDFRLVAAGDTSLGRSADGDPIADVRHVGPDKFSSELRITPWEGASGTVTGAHGTGQCVSDPRGGSAVTAIPISDLRHLGPAKFSTEFRVVRWDRSAGTVTGACGKAHCLSDPRGPSAARPFGKYHVAGWEDSTRTVISSDDNGAYAVADVRCGMDLDRPAYRTGGHFGVVGWDASSGAISAAASHDNGRWSLADPRGLPPLDEKLVVRILSVDGTCHRPFTTLELAALQSYIDPEDPADAAAYGFGDPATGRTRDSSLPPATPFMMHGTSDGAHRERIGNLIPPSSMQAIGNELGRALLLARTGETFRLSDLPVWVRPTAVALMMASQDTYE